MEEIRYVRMKTLEVGEAGLRMFSYAGQRFSAERGWVGVSLEAAAYLAGVRVRAHHPDSALAFEVWEGEAVTAATSSSETVVSLADPAGGDDAPPVQELPPDAPPSAEAREVQEAQEVRETAARGSPSALASASVEGSPSPADAVPAEVQDAPAPPASPNVGDGVAPEGRTASDGGHDSSPRAKGQDGRSRGRGG